MPVAEELKYFVLTKWSTRVGGPLGAEFVVVRKSFNACFNVETLPLPAYGSCLGMRAA